MGFGAFEGTDDPGPPIGLVPVTVLPYLLSMTVVLPMLGISVDALFLVPVHALLASLVYLALLRLVDRGELDMSGDVGISVAQQLGWVAGLAAASVFLMINLYAGLLVFFVVASTVGLLFLKILGLREQQATQQDDDGPDRLA